MRAALALGLVVGLALPAAAGAAAPAGKAADPAEVTRIETQIAHAEHLFSQWRYDEAFALAEKLYAEHPGLPSVQYLAGEAKFYQQDYAGAIALLKRATAGRGNQAEDPILQYAERTYEITKDYVSKRSAHFELRVPPGVDEVLFPYALDTLEQAWQQIGDDFDYHPTRPVVVEAFTTAQELSEASGLPIKAIKTSGTIAICKHNKLMFTSPRSLLRGYEWLDTITHEYVHYVISRSSWNTVPIWLHEGLAKYEESRWNGAGGRDLAPYAEHLLAEAVQGRRKFITFEQMHPSMALLPSQDATALAFAEVFTAIEYLVTQRGGYPAVRKILANLKTGETEEAAIEGALGVSFESFQHDWRGWLSRRPMRGDDAAQANPLTFKEDVKGKVVDTAKDEADAGDDVDNPVARRFAHLGELMRMRGRNLAASKEYEKAYAAVGPKAPLLSTKLAVTYMSLKRFDRAEEVLKAALGPNPSFVTTYVQLGRLYLLTKKPDLAETSFVRANTINPFDPEIHGALYGIYKDRGETALADREAKAYALLQRGEREGDLRPKEAAPEGDVGYLSIHSTPWARVSIDGRDTGMTTPLFRHALEPGRHEVHLSSESGTVDKHLTVEIEKGREKKLVVSLE